MNPVGWLGDIAAVVGPISIIVGLPGALIGSIVAVVKVRRWVIHSFEPAQVATQQAADRATTAANRATTAATSAETSAAKHSEAAKASNAEVERALIYLADELGRTRAALEVTQRKRDVEAERNDEVFAALLRAKTPQVPEQTGGLLIPLSAADEDDPATVTGRHRLHTQHVQTIDEGDHP